MYIWVYVICAIIWIGFILHWVIGSIPNHRIFEIYAGCGIGLCLSLLIFGLFDWYRKAISPIVQLTGNILLYLAIAIAIISLITLKIKGKPKKGIEDTNILIVGTIFGVIRHPLYFGLAIWAVSQILAIQSIISVIMGITAIICFWMASKKEDEFNITKFGDNYKDYMKKIPMWNVLKGLIRKSKDSKDNYR